MNIYGIKKKLIELNRAIGRAEERLNSLKDWQKRDRLFYQIERMNKKKKKLKYEIRNKKEEKARTNKK